MEKNENPGNNESAVHGSDCFFTMLMQAPVALAVFKGKDLVCTMANDAYLELAGKMRDSVVGMPLFESLPATGQALEPGLKTVLETGTPFSVGELELATAQNGILQTRYFNAVWQPARSEDGRTDGVMMAAYEVTEQVKTRGQQQETERRFRSLAENSPDIITRHGKDFRYEYVNPAIEKYTGIPCENFVGASYRELGFPEDICKFFDKELDFVFRSGERHDTEYEMPTGEYVQSRMMPEFDETGAVRSVLIISSEISARRKMERELLFQKQLLESVTENTDMALFLMDDKQFCIYMNEAAEQMTGYSLDELKGKQLHYYIHHIRPDGSPYPLEQCPIDQALPAHKRMKGEEIFVHKDGHFYPVAFTASPILINGEPTATVIEVRNTAEEKAADEELSKREAEFRNFSNNITNLAWMADGSGWIYWYNQRWFDYTGTTLEEMQGWGWQKVHHPDHLQLVLDFVDEAWKSDQPWELTFPLRRHDGEYRWFLTRAVPIKNEQGVVQQWIGTNTDIHEQRIAEQKIKDSEDHFRTLAESLPQLVWAAESDGNVYYYNSKVALYSGASQLEDGKWQWEGLLHPEDLNNTEHAWRAAVRNGTIYSAEHRVQMAGGTFRWHLSRSVPSKNAEGQVTKWFGTATDIHEQKTQEKLLEKKVQERTRELEQLNFALRASNKELEQFAYVASHDLQEPLRKIKAFGGILKTGYQEQLGSKGSDLIDRMQNASERMGVLIDDLLSFSRVSSKKEEFKPVDLNNLVDDLIQYLEVPTREKKASVTRGQLMPVHGSEFQLRQLFQNLLSNALKFSKPGTPPVVHLSSQLVYGKDAPERFALEPDKPYQLITVSDNGIGFEPEYSERIFQIFQRLHGHSDYPGSGIGLAIVQKVVINHDGVVEATGALGQGAVFSIYLPILAPTQ